MTQQLKLQIDKVISNVHYRLLDQNVIVPEYQKGVILVGDVSIVQNGSNKDIVKHGKFVYTGVALNKVAIALATKLAIHHKATCNTDQLYRYDQQYAVYLQDTLFFKSKYKHALAKKQFDRADIFLARYNHAREKALISKNFVLSLITN
jgi:hypothetical protein